MAAGGGGSLEGLRAEMERLDHEIEMLNGVIAPVKKRLANYPTQIKSFNMPYIADTNWKRMNNNARNAAIQKGYELRVQKIMREDTHVKDEPLHLSLLKQLCALQKSREQVAEQIERIEKDIRKAEQAAESARKKAEKEAENAIKALNTRTPAQKGAATRERKKAEAAAAALSKTPANGAAGGGSRSTNGTRRSRKGTRKNRR